METTYIPNAIIGGIFLALSHSLFLWNHQHTLHLPQLFWSITILKPKWLTHYLPVVSGIFFTSGVLFDWMGYHGVGKVNPYGPQQTILDRTSMYGYALGGFCIGIGSQLMNGDQLSHSLIRISQGHWFSIFILALILSSAIFWSWLAHKGYLNLLSNQQINPQMVNLHLVSANITIILAILLIIATACLLSSKINEPKIIAKKIAGSFFTGMFLSLAFCISGLTTRTTLFSGITPNQTWDPILLIFLATATILYLFLYQLIKSNNNIKNLVLESSQSQEQPIEPSSKPQTKIKECLGGLIFGMGWAIAGLDVAVFLIHSSIFTLSVVIIFGAFFIIGSMLGNLI